MDSRVRGAVVSTQRHAGEGKVKASSLRLFFEQEHFGKDIPNHAVTPTAEHEPRELFSPCDSVNLAPRTLPPDREFSRRHVDLPLLLSINCKPVCSKSVHTAASATNDAVEQTSSVYPSRFSPTFGAGPPAANDRESLAGCGIRAESRQPLTMRTLG